MVGPLQGSVDIDEAEPGQGSRLQVLGIGTSEERAVLFSPYSHRMESSRSTTGKQEDKAELMEHYDETVASLQRRSEGILKAAPLC